MNVSVKFLTDKNSQINNFAIARQAIFCRKLQNL